MYFCVVLCIFVLFYVSFCVVLCIVCMYMCTELLPPGTQLQLNISYHMLGYNVWSQVAFLCATRKDRYSRNVGKNCQYLTQQYAGCSFEEQILFGYGCIERRLCCLTDICSVYRS
jgi:hypothetical protein